MKGFFKKLDWNYVFIFFLSFFILLPYVSRLYAIGHDTGYHIANILALNEGMPWSKVFPLIGNSFGYGSGIFYPQLSHIVATLFLKFSFSVVTSMKLTYFLSVFLSGIFMYRFVCVLSKNQSVAFLASLFYMTMPYYLVDIYVRDAFAEAFFFPFLPLVFLGITYYFQGNLKKFFFPFVIGYVFMMETHLVLSMYVTIFLGILFLINYKEFFKKNRFKYFLFAVVCVTLLVLPFLSSMITHKMFGNYAVFSPDFMANSTLLQTHSLNLYEFFFFVSRPTDHMSFYFNVFVILFFLITAFSYKKVRTVDSVWFLKSILVLCPFLFFLISKLCPWRFFPKFLWMIQFPWRLEMLLGFFLSIGAAYVLKLIPKKYYSLVFFFSLFICFFYVNSVVSKVNFQAVDVSSMPLSNLGMGGKEYYPINTVKNFDYLLQRDYAILVKSGNAKVSLLENNFPHLKFSVQNASSSLLELPRIYYFGYTILNEKNEEISYHENENGFIELEVLEDGTYSLMYTGTIIDKICSYLAIFTILFLIGCFFKFML